MKLAITSTRVTSIQKRFSDKEFLVQYNPEAMQLRFAEYSLSDGVQDGIMTLSEIKAAYGLTVVVLYLKNWLVKLNHYMNKTQEMNADQISETAFLLFKKAPQLNLAELCLFFNSIKMSEYGEMQGYLDGLKIMFCLDKFLKNRSETLRRLHAKQRSQTSMSMDAKFLAIMKGIRSQL